MKYELEDHQWKKIKHMLPGQAGNPGKTALDNRKFISAVMWVARNSAPWRALPEKYGNWNSVHRRFMRWSRNGIWQMIFNTLSVNADTKWIMIDSTIVREHQHSSGARKKYSKWYAKTRAGQIKRRSHH